MYLICNNKRKLHIIVFIVTHQIVKINKNNLYLGIAQHYNTLVRTKIINKYFYLVHFDGHH